MKNKNTQFFLLSRIFIGFAEFPDSGRNNPAS